MCVCLCVCIAVCSIACSCADNSSLLVLINPHPSLTFQGGGTGNLPPSHLVSFSLLFSRARSRALYHSLCIYIAGTILSAFCQELQLHFSTFTFASDSVSISVSGVVFLCGFPRTYVGPIRGSSRNTFLCGLQAHRRCRATFYAEYATHAGKCGVAHTHFLLHMPHTSNSTDLY